MSWFDRFFPRKPSESDSPPPASQAKERLQIVLAHERIGRTREDFLPKLQQELLQVIAKYVKVDPDSVKVDMERSDNLELLAINIVLPDQAVPPAR